MYPEKKRLGLWGEGPLVGIDWLTYRRSTNQGITTIFRRIENILDFIISVCKDKIHSYQRTMTYEEYKINQSKLFTPPVSDPDNKKWNDEHDGMYIKYEDMYRWCVLQILNEMIQELKVTRNGESGAVVAVDAADASTGESVEPSVAVVSADAPRYPVSISYITHELPIIPLSYDDFNDIINVCNEQPAHQSKLAIYKNISTDLYKVLHSLPEYKTFPFFENVEETKEHELDNTLKMWNASCLSTLDYILQQISSLAPHMIFNYIIQNGRGMRRTKEVNEIEKHFLLKIKEYIDTKRAEFTDAFVMNLIDNIENLGQRRLEHGRDPYISDNLYTTLIDLIKQIFNEWISKKSPEEALQFIKTLDSLKHISIGVKDKLKTEEFFRFQMGAAMAAVDVPPPMGAACNFTMGKLKKKSKRKKSKFTAFSKKGKRGKK